MILSTEQRAAVEAYAEQMTQHELNRCRQSNPEKLDKLIADNPEIVNEYRAREIATAEQLVADFHDTDKLYQHWASGRFHPSNKSSRAMFSAVTGHELPPTVRATSDTVREIIGIEYCESVEREATERAANAERERLERESTERAAVIAEIVARINADEHITGAELLDVARFHGIDVHPRTAGMLKSRVGWITSSQARITGKGHVDSAFRIYRQVADSVNPSVCAK